MAIVSEASPINRNEMNTTIQIFENNEFGAIRTMSNEQGEPLFCAKDVAVALGYKLPRKAVQDHVDKDDVLKRNLIDSLGREQLTTFINESGLYSLIIGSKLEGARRFKHWVTAEVLPFLLLKNKSLSRGERGLWGASSKLIAHGSLLIAHGSLLIAHGSLLIEILEAHLEVHLVGAEHLAGLAAIDGAHDAGFLELIHDAACTVVANGELALDERGGA